MEKVLRGKYLVRKAKLTESNNDVLIITGIFFPTNFDINEIKDNDEMWVSDLLVMPGGIKFTDPKGKDGGSPEDFLEGEMTSPSCWKNKKEL